MTNLICTSQDVARAYSEGYRAGHDDGVDQGRLDAQNEAPLTHVGCPWCSE